MDAFVAQLDTDELEAISRGAYVMGHPLGAEGNAGVFGGVLASLLEKGIPAVTTTDGPSGIRLKASCSLIPVGTLLACTFDEKLVEELYAKVGEEMVDRGSDVLLAPGMNIHRKTAYLPVLSILPATIRNIKEIQTAPMFLKERFVKFT